MKNIIFIVILVSLLIGCEKNFSEKSAEPTLPTETNTIAKSQSTESETVPTLKSDQSDEMIATIGDGGISTNDLLDYLNYRPIQSNKPVDKSAIKAKLQEMVIAEILKQEAMKLNLHLQPKIRRNIQQLLNQQLLKEQVEEPILNQTLTDAELQDYYNQNRHLYERSKQVRVADIYIAKGSDADQARMKASQVLQEALAIQGKRSGFGQLIQKHSDSPNHYAKGDTGYFDQNAPTSQFAQSFVNAAFQLEKVGQIHDQVVETEEGFHIIMLTGKRPPLKRSFEQVKSAIVAQVRKERLKNSHDQFIANLESQASIEINDALIEKVLSEVSKKELSAVDMRNPSMVPPQLPN